VHLSYAREGTGHALVGARQWIPRQQVSDQVLHQKWSIPNIKKGLSIRICPQDVTNSYTALLAFLVTSRPHG
jgi:hypothetical protein